MKNLLKNAGYKLSAILALIVLSQTSVLAEGSTSTNVSASLSAGQVIGATALLIGLIIVPIFKGARRVAAN